MLVRRDSPMGPGDVSSIGPTPRYPVQAILDLFDRFDETRVQTQKMLRWKDVRPGRASSIYIGD